jgi:hypothetical protein
MVVAIIMGAIAEATMVAVGVGADLPPVQFSADCSLRPTITDRRPVTITDLRKKMRWHTACNGSDHMILVAAPTWAMMDIGTLALRRIKT